MLNASPSVNNTFLHRFGEDFWVWTGLFIFILFIPIAKPASTLGEILALLAWLPGLATPEIRTQRWNNLISRPWLLFLPAFYMLYLLGMCWTTDLDQGLKELNMQHYLLIIPLLLGSLNRQIHKEQYLFAGFLFANLIAACLTIFIRQTDIPVLNAELYLPSPFIARPRASLFYAFSLFLLLDLPWHFTLKGKKKMLWLICTFIMAMALFNLEGRTGQIAFALTLPVWMVFRLVKQNRLLWFSLFSVMVILMAYLSYTYIGNIQRRFREAWEEMQSYQTGFQDRNANDTSFARRFIFLEKSYEVFKANPIMGVGSGDLQNEVYPLFENQAWGIAPNKPHNQFLEIAVKFGLIGLLFFIAGWIWQIKTAGGERKILFYCFSIVCLVSMLSESTLDTQAGISFFVIFNCLLLLEKKSNNSDNSTSET